MKNLGVRGAGGGGGCSRNKHAAIEHAQTLGDIGGVSGGSYDVLFKKHACIFSFTYTVVLRQCSLINMVWVYKQSSFF